MSTKLALRFFALLCFLGTEIIQLSAQKVKFSLQYNEESKNYQVYGKADFADEQFFVGGGSQLSIILPTGLVDYPLTIQSVAGGPWTDNSQVYTPTVDANHDYHGIATNGSRMNFQPGVETLLFTFELPKGVNKYGVRLFDNEKDPHSNQLGMGGADFCNFFACALTVKNVYGGIYSNTLELESPLVTLDGIGLTPDFDLFQNQPNPFKGETSIGFLLPQDAPIELTFRDVTGKTLKVLKLDGQTGSNKIQVPIANFPKGLIHYQLDTPFGSKNKKMIYIE